MPVDENSWALSCLFTVVAWYKASTSESAQSLTHARERVDRGDLACVTGQDPVDLRHDDRVVPQLLYGQILIAHVVAVAQAGLELSSHPGSCTCHHLGWRG